MANTWVFNQPLRDFLQRPVRNPSPFSNVRPFPFCALKVVEHVSKHRSIHAAHTRPVFGFIQPANGFYSNVSYKAMKGLKKSPKVAGFMRTILAANIAALLEKHYADLKSVTARQKQLAEDAQTTLATIQRVMKQETGPSLDTIEAIATVFGVSTYQLLIPNLHVDNPQVVNGATKEEERLYAGWRRAKLSERKTAKA